MSDSKKLYASLSAIHSALDDALGDSDVTHIDDDDELRSEHPTQWAAQKLAEVIAALHSDAVADGALVKNISDKDMRELLSAKDVGKGRAVLKRILAALRSAPVKAMCRP